MPPRDPVVPTSNAGLVDAADLVDAIRQDLLACGLEGDLAAVPSLASYLQLLERWNSTYNLTSVRDIALMRTQHLADCLAVVPALRQIRAPNNATRLLDVGSGGGLPGVVLAILHPAWRVDCVDTVGKKVAFIRQAAGQLSLSNLKAVQNRVETINTTTDPATSYDLIISRAFGSLSSFVNLSRAPARADGSTVWLAMKGKIPEEELKALPLDVEVRSIQEIDVPGSEAARCIVVMNVRNS